MGSGQKGGGETPPKGAALVCLFTWGREVLLWSGPLTQYQGSLWGKGSSFQNLCRSWDNAMVLNTVTHVCGAPHLTLSFSVYFTRYIGNHSHVASLSPTWNNSAGGRLTKLCRLGERKKIQFKALLAHPDGIFLFSIFLIKIADSIEKILILL